MKRIISVESLLSSIRPLYYSSRIFGLSPFHLTRDFTLSRVGIGWKLYATAILATVLCCSVLSLVKRVQQSQLPTTSVVNEFLHICTGATEAIVSIVLCVTLNGPKSRTIISKIIKIDKTVLTDSNKTYRKTLIFTSVQVISLYSYAIAVFTLDIFVWKDTLKNISIWLLISGYPHRILNLGTVVQFSDLVLLLRNRFQALNSKLNHILKESGKTYNGSLTFSTVSHNAVLESNVTEWERDFPELNNVRTVPFAHSFRYIRCLRQPRRLIPQQTSIRILREIYDELCDISVLINSMYGLQILLQIGISTAEFISAVYFMLYTILAKQNVTANTISKFTTLMLSWLLLTFFKLISITAPCHSATNHVENTAVLVQKLLLKRHFDLEANAQLQLFSHQLFQRKVKFTALRFLHLDYSLLLTIIGGATTYLVIVTQYGK
jgi:hypothetical protein